MASMNSLIGKSAFRHCARSEEMAVPSVSGTFSGTACVNLCSISGIIRCSKNLKNSTMAHDGQLIHLQISKS